ncbi:MAG: hypothetical protein ACYTEQ_24835 [Planctomycetota bacterium]|jgi:hypothetical protein
MNDDEKLDAMRKAAFNVLEFAKVSGDKEILQGVIDEADKTIAWWSKLRDEAQEALE